MIYVAKQTTAAMASVLIALLLASCTAAEPPSPINLAVVVGQHQGAGPVVSDGRLVENVAGQLKIKLARPGSLTVIVNDGNPYALGTIELQFADGSPSQAKDAIAANQVKFEGFVEAAQPKEEQADPLMALSKAADAVAGKENPEIFVIDNGLSTAGALLMQTGVIHPGRDTASLIKGVSMNGIPNLEGVTVTWMGMCQVSKPQTSCPPWARDALREFYGDYIESAGGSVTFDDSPLPDTDQPPMPTVATVPFETITVANVSEEPPADDPAPPVISIILDETTVQFKSDSDSFVDPAKAEGALREVSTELSSERVPFVYIIGCTHDDSPRSTAEGMRKRSESRANTVATKLREFGATSELRVEGRGPACPGFVAARPENNRRTIITNQEI